MNPSKIPIVNENAVERVVDEGRWAMVDMLVVDWTPQGLCDEAFEDALSEVHLSWLDDAIETAGALRPPEKEQSEMTRQEKIDGYNKAYSDITGYFDRMMTREKRWIMRQARAKLLDRAERIVIRVFRNRIEIVDLYSNESLQQYGKQKSQSVL